MARSVWCDATGASLGAALGVLVTERALDLPASGAHAVGPVGGHVPEHAGYVAVVSYDPGSGSPACELEKRV